MKILATKTTADKLEPGDLFSGRDQKYWDGVVNESSLFFNDLVVAHAIFFRSIIDCPDEQKNTVVYKIKIIK